MDAKVRILENWILMKEQHREFSLLPSFMSQHVSHWSADINMAITRELFFIRSPLRHHVHQPLFHPTNSQV